MSRFEHFRVVRIALPCQTWVRCYDLEREVIWINTAAPEGCNIVKMTL